MPATKDRNTNPKTGGLRRQPESQTRRFIWADASQEEHEEIRAYCRQKGISISQFMAHVVLKDTTSSKSRRKQGIILKPEIKLTPQQHDKLEVLARLHRKKSVGEFILDILLPELELQRLHVPGKKRMLRYSLTEQQHKRVISHIAPSGLSATNYATMLALRAIRKDSGRSRK